MQDGAAAAHQEAPVVDDLNALAPPHCHASLPGPEFIIECGGDVVTTAAMAAAVCGAAEAQRWSGRGHHSSLNACPPSIGIGVRPSTNAAAAVRRSGDAGSR